MPLQPVRVRIEQNYNGKNNKIVPKYNVSKNANKNVSFQGGIGYGNPVSRLASRAVIGFMDLIASGGFALAFILQDGIGFVIPRVTKGLLRGGKEKKDSNGNVILDKNGKPKHELNYAYARKEGLREIITGPSAFVIPFLLLKGIKKYSGSANDVRLDYIDSFGKHFAKIAQNNVQSIKPENSKIIKESFYNTVFEDVLRNSINSDPNALKLTEDEITKYAKDLTKKQLDTENILSKKLSKKERAAELGKFPSVEDTFMKLKKSRIGGNVNETAVSITSSKGDIKGGSIDELTKAMKNYFGDAFNKTLKALTKDSAANITDIVNKFTKHRMSTRLFTNVGLFLSVAAFFTQIPKLYNMGLKSNPALEQKDDTPALVHGGSEEVSDSVQPKQVAFGSLSGFVDKAGQKVFNNRTAKSISDIYELSGPIIQGSAMATLLYAFCIPPRLIHAQDKYDYGEIVVRDLTAFTALLFGAKALARVFSDGLTKWTGLALNKKNLEGRSSWKKVIDYLNPADARHSVLSSVQLDSKYMNINEYKGGIDGFIEFIEGSGGNIKKAFKHDRNIKGIIEKMLKKPYESASAADIKSALQNAHANSTDEIKELYELFKKPNGLLNKAKTCNSLFGFISTLVLVPGLIIALTDICKKMTDKRQAKDNENKIIPRNQILQSPVIHSNKPTMAGFLGQNKS